MIELLIKMIICHMIGDYVLQQDFIAKTKGQNLYHMFIHCVLYTAPFMYLFGILSYQSLIIFTTHMIIDLSKAARKMISYCADQVLHYIVIVGIWVYAVISVC